MKTAVICSLAMRPGFRSARIRWALAGGLGLAVARGLAAPAPAARVVSLAPSLTEIVCALGAADQLVGRTSACDYPPEPLKNVPVVGGFGAPSLELVLRQRPTAVLDVGLEDEALGRPLGRLGIQRHRIPCRSLGDIPAAIRAVGRLVHRETEAERLAAQFAACVVRCRQDAAALAARRAPPKVYAEIWSDPPMTCGRRTFLAELIALAGGRNVGDAFNRDYLAIAPEWILLQQPEVILLLHSADAQALPGLLRGRRGWDLLPAVRNQRVFSGLDNNLLLRPGPRALEGVELLRKCLAPAPGADPVRPGA